MPINVILIIIVRYHHKKIYVCPWRARVTSCCYQSVSYYALYQRGAGKVHSIIIIIKIIINKIV